MLSKERLINLLFYTTHILRSRHTHLIADQQVLLCLIMSSHCIVSHQSTLPVFLRHNESMRLLGYTRVSTVGQDSHIQSDALLRSGVEERDIFSDVTSGAKNATERPAMQRLLSYAQSGDTVVVWRIDRLGRSLIDVLNTVDLLRDQSIKVQSISDGIDPETSAGRMMLGMLATLAEYERELITERVNAGIAAARERGTKFGRPPVDPEVVARKLAIAAEERAKGRTAEQAARIVGWSRATLYRHQSNT